MGDAERPPLAEAVDRPRSRQEARPPGRARGPARCRAGGRSRPRRNRRIRTTDGWDRRCPGRSRAAPASARNSQATGCAGASGTPPAVRRNRRSRASGRSAPGSRPAPRRCGRAPTPCRARIHPGARAHKPRPGGDAWAAAARSRSGGAERRRSSPAARSVAWSLIVFLAPARRSRLPKLERAAVGWKSSLRGAQRRSNPENEGRLTFPWIASLRSQ